MSDKKTVQERWQAYLEEVVEVSKKHDLAGIGVTAILPEQGEDGKTSLPVYGGAFFPRIGGATLLYALRDQSLRILKESADASIEAALKAMEESATAASEDKAEASPVAEA